MEKGNTKLTEYISGWIEGATAASRFFALDKSGESWLTPATIPAWAAFGAAILSAFATFQAVKISRQTIVHENRKEALRLLIETCSLYEKVIDYLSVEMPVWKSRFNQFPQTSSVMAAKDSILEEIKARIKYAEERHASHYKLLESTLYEKSRSIITWQETLTNAQMSFAEAGRTMSIVAQSLNSHIERLDNLTETAP